MEYFGWLFQMNTIVILFYWIRHWFSCYEMSILIMIHLNRSSCKWFSEERILVRIHKNIHIHNVPSTLTTNNQLMDNEELFIKRSWCVVLCSKRSQFERLLRWDFVIHLLHLQMVWIRFIRSIVRLFICREFITHKR